MQPRHHLYTYQQFLQEYYGEVLHRVPLDVGFSCPNRLPDGSGGCSFCPQDGARAPQLDNLREIGDQVRAGVSFARRRYGARQFMAYLQAFTNTFTSADELRRLVGMIRDEHDFRAISFGTRPDCLSDAALDFLAELNREIDVWIELGVQTMHDATLRRIGRGHNAAASREAIQRIHAAGLKTAVHLIIGLPGEGLRENRQSLLRLAELPVDGIKLHNLHIVRGTRLAEEFQAQPFALPDEHQYVELLLELIPFIPAHWPVIRFTTDTQDEQLIAPRWTMEKSRFRNYLLDQLRLRQVWQGMALDQVARKNQQRKNGTGAAPGTGACTGIGTCAGAETGRFRTVESDAQTAPADVDPAAEKNAEQEPSAAQAGVLQAVKTDDGSLTFWNPEVKEHYHSPAGARGEAVHKYVLPSGLEARLRPGESLAPRPSLHLLDICFGLGYNSLVSVDLAIRHGASLSIVGLEIDRRVVAAAADQLAETETSFDWNLCLHRLATEGRWQQAGCSIEILWGDARHTIRKAGSLGRSFSLMWLDAFSTQRNSELWTVDFFRCLHPLLSEDGALYTYCAAIPVRAGLLEAGFHVGETEPFGRPRGGTVAGRRADAIQLGLPERDRFLMSTSRGIPYRDPALTRTNKEILRARQDEIVRFKQDSEKDSEKG